MSATHEDAGASGRDDREAMGLSDFLRESAQGDARQAASPGAEVAQSGSERGRESAERKPQGGVWAQASSFLRGLGGGGTRARQSSQPAAAASAAGQGQLSEQEQLEWCAPRPLLSSPSRLSPRETNLPVIAPPVIALCSQ